MNENPDPSLFVTYERLETCHRVEVTEDNMHLIAKHFGWSVSYAATGRPTLVAATGENRVISIGASIDRTGSRWNPDPLTQGWSPEGTFSAALATPADEIGQ